MASSMPRMRKQLHDSVNVNVNVNVDQVDVK